MAELGILLRTYLPIEQSIELVQEAERRGFHSVWVTESMDSKDAFTQMAAWAMKTERIHVGSGITPIYTRTPVMSGMTMLSLAELSGERAILGLGTGHPFGVEEGHGVKLDRPLASIREYTEIVRLVTQKREFSYHGEVFNIPGYAGYERSHFETHPFRIPIFLAALRSGMVRLAGELADGVLMNLATPEYIRRAVDIFRQEARSAGRDLRQMTFASIVNASVSQDEGAAAETVRRSVAMYPTLMPFYRRMLRETGFADEMRAIAPEVATGDVEAATRKIPDSMLRSLGVFGSARQAREGLKVFEETEADLLVLHPFVAEGADTGQAIADVIQAFGR